MANSPSVDTVHAWLETDITPYVLAHNGAVRVVEYQPNQHALTLELSGACSTCPFVMMTIQHGIKQRFKQAFSEYDPIAITVTIVE